MEHSEEEINAANEYALKNPKVKALAQSRNSFLAGIDYQKQHSDKKYSREDLRKAFQDGKASVIAHSNGESIWYDSKINFQDWLNENYPES